MPSLLIKRAFFACSKRIIRIYSLEALKTFQPMTRWKIMNSKGCLAVMLDAGSTHVIVLRLSKNQQQIDDDNQKGSMIHDKRGCDDNDPLAIMW